MTNVLRSGIDFILSPLRGFCRIHNVSRGFVLRTPPPACILATPSGFALIAAYVSYPTDPPPTPPVKGGE